MDSLFNDSSSDYNDTYNDDGDYFHKIFNGSSGEVPLSIPNLYEISTVGWFAIVMYLIVFVLGVPGNCLVVWVTSFEMKRTVNSVWFLHLAVADLLCCFAAPFSIMAIALGHWPLGLFACKTIPSLLLINLHASVLLLMMISIDRCALVVKPVWCQNKRTVRKAYVACLVIWIFALILSSYSFVFRETITGKSNGKMACVYKYSRLKNQRDQRQKVENSIAIFRLFMGFVIPFVVIALCYGVLMRRVSGRYTQSTKTLKVVLVVIIGFFVCWLPYHIFGLILAVNGTTSTVYKSVHHVDPLIIALAFVNSCINPIIYVLAGREFKSKFKRSITFILQNVLAEDVSQTLDSKKSKSTSDTKNTEALV